MYSLLFWTCFHCQPLAPPPRYSRIVVAASVTSLRAEKREEQREREKGGETEKRRDREEDNREGAPSRTRVRVAAVIYTRGPTNRPRIATASSAARATINSPLLLCRFLFPLGVSIVCAYPLTYNPLLLVSRSFFSLLQLTVIPNFLPCFLLRPFLSVLSVELYLARSVLSDHHGPFCLARAR